MGIGSLLRLRRKMKKKKPAFVSQEGMKRVKLSESWRKPRGRHSKLKQHEKARGRLPGPGYGSPSKVRGMNRSGLMEVLVSNVRQTDGIDPKTQSIVIASSVGRAKRAQIIEAAKKKSIRIQNA